MFEISPFTRVQILACNLIVSNDGTRIYVMVIIVLLHVNHNAFFVKVEQCIHGIRIMNPELSSLTFDRS